MTSISLYDVTSLRTVVLTTTSVALYDIQFNEITPTVNCIPCREQGFVLVSTRQCLLLFLRDGIFDVASCRTCAY